MILTRGFDTTIRHHPNIPFSNLDYTITQSSQSGVYSDNNHFSQETPEEIYVLPVLYGKRLGGVKVTVTAKPALNAPKT